MSPAAAAAPPPSRTGPPSGGTGRRWLPGRPGPPLSESRPLLPGLCSLFFMIPFLIGEGPVGGLGMVWLMTFVIAAGGILLIGYAWRNR